MMTDVEEKGESTRAPSVAVRQSSTASNEGNGVRSSLKRLLSLGSDEENKGSIQKSPSTRSVMRRTNTFTLKDMSAAEVTNLMQDTIYKESYTQMLRPYLPLILW
jgi:hypothetical protein